MKEEKMNQFSVPLGLLDYGNPILYTITSIVLITHLQNRMTPNWYYLLVIGIIMSLIFGFIIPTGKVLVGLKIIKFRMPVSLVFLVNTGLFLTGITLMKYTLKIPIIVWSILVLIYLLFLLLIYYKTKKVNTIAVLIGAIGYLLIYTSLITEAMRERMILPIILYGIAIILFIFLCGVGMKANLKKPKVHWLIEICNVICQFLVTISTIMLFY